MAFFQTVNHPSGMYMLLIFWKNIIHVIESLIIYTVDFDIKYILDNNNTARRYYAPMKLVKENGFEKQLEVIDS